MIDVITSYKWVRGRFPIGIHVQNCFLNDGEDGCIGHLSIGIDKLEKTSNTWQPNQLWFSGIISGCGVVLIWSGWIVSSRWGLHNLTVVDLTWLRFTMAAILTLPLSLRYNWKKMPVRRAMIIALGCGFPYTLLIYYGLNILPSANVSVIVNGSLPIITAIFAVFFLKKTFTRMTLMLLVTMFVANLMVMSSSHLFNINALYGLSLLLLAAIALAIYMTAVKLWDVSLKDILVWVPTINAVLVTPIWIISDSNLSECPLKEILFHLFYQGFLVSIVALFLFSYTVKILGSVITSMFTAFVPALTALLGILFLSEWPTSMQWIGIGLCMGGLLASCYKTA